MGQPLICFILLVILYFASLVTSDCIRTTGGNSDGACCVFPYIYKGKKMRSCTRTDFTHNWCATTGNYDTDRKWGLCRDCIRTVSGHCCKFPAAYNGKSFNTCTTMNHHRPWCFNEQGVWENCQATACSVGWHYFKGSCYKSYRDEVTWAAAREVCKMNDADLVKILSAQRNEFVHRDLALPMDSASLTGMWLGLHRSATEDREFRWVDGQPLNYSNWSPQEPNDHKKDEGCAEIVIPAAYKAQWNDINCRARMTFACEEVIGDPCKIRNGDCAHYCHTSDFMVNCSCSTGYRLAANARSCEDIDECQTNNGGCSQKCVNTAGKFYCECDHEGLGLDEDKKNCVDIDECKSENGKCSDLCINTYGSYHCACTQPEFTIGKDNRTCAIPPLIVHHLNNETFLEGAHLIMTCISIGVPAPTFQWRKNGNTSIPRAEHYGSSAILSITDLKYEDQGLYECTASNIGGEVKTTSFISVKVPPSFYNVSETTTVLEGSDVTLYCRTRGIPEPEVTWVFLAPKRTDVGTGEVLKIANVSADHDGRYICRASNGIGQDVQQIISLKVRYAPVIDLLRSESRLISTVGQKVIISCRANGNPPPRYTWIKNDQQIKPKSHSNVKLLGKDIVVFPKHIKDFGLYKCIAKNELGTAQHTISLVEVADKALTSAFKMNPEDGAVPATGLTVAVILLLVTVVALIVIIAFLTYRNRRYSSTNDFVKFSKGATNPLHSESGDLSHLNSKHSFSVSLDEEDE